MVWRKCPECLVAVLFTEEMREGIFYDWVSISRANSDCCMCRWMSACIGEVG